MTMIWRTRCALALVIACHITPSGSTSVSSNHTREAVEVEEDKQVCASDHFVFLQGRVNVTEKLQTDREFLEESRVETQANTLAQLLGYPIWGRTGIPRILHQTSKHGAQDNAYWQGTWDRGDFFTEHFHYDDAGLEEIIKGDSYVWGVVEHIWPELSPVERADVFRYAVVFLKGGFYADVDVTLSEIVESWPKVVPMAQKQESQQNASASDTRQHEGGLLLVGYETQEHLTSPQMAQLAFADPEQLEQWFFAAAPRHPVLKRCLELIAANKGKNLDTLKLTGPGVFSEAVHELTARSSETSALSSTNATLSVSDVNGYSRLLDYTKNQETESLSVPPHTLVALPNGYQVYFLFTKETGGAEHGTHAPVGIEELVHHHYLGSWK